MKTELSNQLAECTRQLSEIDTKISALQPFDKVRAYLTQYALIKKHGISPAQITRLKHNKHVSTHTLDMMCTILDCRIQDILEYVKE